MSSNPIFYQFELPYFSLTSAAVNSNAVVLLLLSYCLLLLPWFVGFLCLSLFCYALLCVHSSFAIISKRKRKLVALLLLSYRCIVTINVLWLFLTVPWVGLQYVIVVFPDHTHLLFVEILCLVCLTVNPLYVVSDPHSGLISYSQSIPPTRTFYFFAN